MKNTLIGTIFLLVVVDHSFAKAVAEPEPWLGNQVKKYCEKVIKHINDPETACQKVTSAVVDKLHNWCIAGAKKICSVTLGYKDKCTALIDEYVCPEIQSTSTRLGHKGVKKPWLQRHLEQICHEDLEPALKKNINKPCDEMKEVVGKNCKKFLSDLCLQSIEKVATTTDAKNKVLSDLLDEEDVKVKKSNRIVKKSSWSSVFKEACTSSIAKSVYHTLCK